MEIMSDTKLKVDHKRLSSVNPTLKKGYKQTEVGMIPIEWDVIRLGDVFDFKNGLNKEKKYFGVGTPIINYVDVYKNREITSKNFQGKVTVTKNELKAYEARKDDVFFTRTSETVDEIGLSSVVTQDLQDTVFSGFVLRARPKNNCLDTFYKKYCFSSQKVRKEITSKSSYTTRALTNGKLLSAVQIPLPPIAEQQIIAEGLSNIDELICTLDAMIIKKRNIKHGAMQQLLTGKKRLPGFTENWEVKKIIDISPLQRGFDLPTTLLKKGIFPVVYSNGILNYHINYKVKAPGVVTGRSGTIGKVTFVNHDYWPHNTSLWVTDFKGNDPKFIYYIFTFIKLEKFSTGSGVPTLNRNDIHALKVPLSPLREQQVIAEVLSDMDAEINRLEQQLNKTKLIKQGMMQELLTGKTRLI